MGKKGIKLVRRGVRLVDAPQGGIDRFLIKFTPILCLLYYTEQIYHKGLLRTQLAKLLFLVNKEKKISLPYTFIKDNFGPYDREIKFDTQLMEFKDLITIRKSSRAEKTPIFVHQITDQGEQLLLRHKSKKLDDACQAIVKQYGNLSLKDLKDYIYGKYCLPVSQLEKIREELNQKLIELKTVFYKEFLKDYSDSILEILTSIDFSIYILRDFDKIEDSVGKNILTSEIKELSNHIYETYVDLLGKDTCVFDKVLADDSQFRESFNYINENVKKYGLQSLRADIEDVGVFLSEEEKKCLTQNLVNA